MWLADNWKDYEVIDCSKGEKLERWGDYILVRPDPQVIWDTPRKEKGWHKMNAHYHRSKKGGGEWEFFDLPQQWSIHYRNLTFQLKPFSFKHTGLFPEQAANWDWFSELIKKAGRPVKVLNLFAYTGGATIAAAAAGASTCSLVRTVPAPTSISGNCSAIRRIDSSAASVRNVTSAHGSPPSTSASASGTASFTSSSTTTGTTPIF